MKCSVGERRQKRKSCCACGWLEQKRSLAHIVSVWLFCLVQLSVSHVHASDDRTELDVRANSLYQQVLSPFCPGRSLNDCPSSKAHELKNEMRNKLEQGLSEAAILQEVFTKFGDQYRAVPDYSGFGKLVWWVPAAFLFIGVAIVTLVTRGKRRASQAKNVERREVLSDEMRATIQRELESLDS